MSSLRFKRLRVTAHLRTPIISDGALPLDGILLYYACSRHYPELAGNIPARGFVYDPAIVPLERRGGPENWYYAASFAFFGDSQRPAFAGITQTSWNKRFDLALAMGRVNAKRVDTGRGPYKAYHHNITCVHAPEVHWYAVGNPDEVASLLTNCTAIGKKRAQGYGMVERWTVTLVREDWSEWRNGRLTRAVPIDHVGRVTHPVVGQWAVRPPYWDISSVQLCALPDDWAE